METYWLGKPGWQLAILRIVGLALNNPVGRVLPIANPDKGCFQKVTTFAGEGKSPAAWAPRTFRNTWNTLAPRSTEQPPTGDTYPAKGEFCIPFMYSAAVLVMVFKDFKATGVLG